MNLLITSTNLAMGIADLASITRTYKDRRRLQSGVAFSELLPNKYLTFTLLCCPPIVFACIPTEKVLCFRPNSCYLLSNLQCCDSSLLRLYPIQQRLRGHRQSSSIRTHAFLADSLLLSFSLLLFYRYHLGVICNVVSIVNGFCKKSK